MGQSRLSLRARLEKYCSLLSRMMPPNVAPEPFKLCTIDSVFLFKTRLPLSFSLIPRPQSSVRILLPPPLPVKAAIHLRPM